MTRPFLDVPVYRLAEDDYYRRRAEYQRTGIAPMLQALGEEASDPKHGPMIANAKHHLIQVYGGMWRFNEIIGYIRLHFVGSQVRGEYVGVNKRRLVRSRTKQFEWRTHNIAMEAQIAFPITDCTILAAVREYLTRCRGKMPRRCIDVASLEVLAEHIRWHDLWAATNPVSPS